MISSIISRLVILVFGTLYPAYASYKAVRTKNVKEYVKWMMYWIVFALFTCAETFTDVFCSFWFPFYYEFKVILVLWLLSPATKGSSILYRKFVHPMLTKREQEIDEYIAKAKEQGYHTVLTLGSKGVNYATTVIMQTAIKGGGGLVNQLRRSYSLSDISADMDALAEMNRIKALPEDELDIGDTPMPIDPRLRRSRGYSPRRSASGSGRVEMYFPEVDVNVRQRGTRPRETGIPLSHIRSNEDVSSGYSSAEMLYSGHPPAAEAQEPLVRTSSVGSSRVTRTKVTRGGAVPKRPTAAEDNLSWSESEESDSGNQEEYFYDVPSASPSEPVAILPYAVPSQPAPSQRTVGDFKCHLPVAVMCEPQEIQEGMLAPEKTVECTDSLLNLTSSLNLTEQQADLISGFSYQEREGIQISMETSQIDKISIVDELKTFIGEITTPIDDSVPLGVVGKESQSCEMKTSASDNETSFPEVPKNDNEAQAGELITPTVVDEELEKTQENIIKNMPQELDAEFFYTETDTPQNFVPLTENSYIPAVTSECPPVSKEQIENEDKQEENTISQKPIEEFWKDGRAGRYHKHPAPCPPPKPNTELLKPSTHEAESIVEPVTSNRKSPSPRRESPVPKSPHPSPNDGKKKTAEGQSGGISQASDEQVIIPSTEICGDTVNTHCSVMAAHVDKLDVKPSGSDNAKYKVLASPNQTRKESKSKQDTRIISRLLSKPKSQLASFFPFLSTRDELPPLSELLTTSLTSLDGDLRAQDLVRSSSIIGMTPTNSDHMSVPPQLPPRKKTPERSCASSRETAIKDDNFNEDSKGDGTRMNIREMSHSPPRRHAKSD